MKPDSVKKLELVPVEDASIRREHLIARLDRAIPLLRERGVEKVLLYGSVLDPKRFHEISDIDLALSGKDFSFREQLQIVSLLEEVFGEDGFDAVFLTGEELSPRKVILESILREAVDAEQFIESSFSSDKRRVDAA